LNKLSAAAIGVRRAFVTSLVARKTPPKGAAQFVADCLARDSFMLTHHQAADTAAEFLGADAGRDGLRTLIARLPASGDGRAQVITLALVLGALESKAGKDAWRSPSPLVDKEDGVGRYYRTYGVSTGDYLRWLAGQGYTLSAVEQVVIGERSAAEVYDHYVADTVTPTKAG
jgi:ParB family transcriptional regulator, chromosome partitioning protein